MDQPTFIKEYIPGSVPKIIIRTDQTTLSEDLVTQLVEEVQNDFPTAEPKAEHIVRYNELKFMFTLGIQIELPAHEAIPPGYATVLTPHFLVNPSNWTFVEV